MWKVDSPTAPIVTRTGPVVASIDLLACGCYIKPICGPRPLFQFTPADFTPVESHLQKWRFDADVLPRVRILTSAKGQAVHAVLAAYVSERSYALSEHYFADVEAFDASREEAAVASWLQSHDADSGQEVLVSHGSTGV
jgi:hypothetical protein